MATLRSSLRNGDSDGDSVSSQSTADGDSALQAQMEPVIDNPASWTTPFVMSLKQKEVLPLLKELNITYHTKCILVACGGWRRIFDMSRCRI